MLELSGQELFNLCGKVRVGHVQAVHDVTREPVSFANLISCSSDDVLSVVDLDVIVCSDAILGIVALPPVPEGIESFTFPTLQSCELLHHLTSCSLAAIMLSDIVVNPR